jgi:hypothetical protein
VHSYLTYPVLATRTTSVSDATAAAAFNRKNVEKVKNVYLPSLMMKVPDHLCLRRHIYMSHVNKVQPVRIKMKCIAAIRVTCICVAQDINDPVLSSLKMEGIHFFYPS